MFAFIFPGQGSQSIGMGKEFFEAFEESKHVFQQVDDALAENLSHIIFEDPHNLLNQTIYTQPALMTVSLAIFKILEKEFKVEPLKTVFAGHSLGEYSAHAAIKTFSLEDTANLLRIRGQAMQEAVPLGLGGMAALLGNGGIEKAEELCRSVSRNNLICEVANDNSAEQIVISGHKESIDLASEKAQEFGFKRAIKLEVSAPFHCSLMHNAAEIMHNHLVDTSTQPLQHKIIANVTADYIDTPDKVKDLLVKQVTGRVRWRESILKMHHDGVNTFIEVGAGKVLTNLVKRILPDVKTFTINTPHDLENFLKNH